MTRETGRASTRDQLLTVGLRLFAERGFDTVSVGEIERSVGLVPRRGALYRHFASKEALLVAAVGEYLDSVATPSDLLTGPPGGDVYDSAVVLARYVLAEMDRQHDITRVLERDGDRLPELRETFRREISERGYAVMADILTGWLAGPDDADAVGGRGNDEHQDESRGLAVHLLGGLINARRSAWTLGHPPGQLDDAQIVHAWADLCVRLVRPHG